MVQDDAPAACSFQIDVGRNNVHFRLFIAGVPDFFDHVVNGGGHVVRRMELARRDVQAAARQDVFPCGADGSMPDQPSCTRMDADDFFIVGP